MGDTYYRRASQSAHGLDDGRAYINYEGNYYAVYRTFQEAMEALDGTSIPERLAEFSTEEELDKYLGEE
jgi:hypothetical protein